MGFHKKKRKYCWTQKDYDHETKKAQFGNLTYENAWPQKKRKKKKRVGKSIQKRKELTFESRLWSSLWRLMGHAHKSLPVGMVCHQMNTPSLAHPQALPLQTIIRTYRWAILLYPKLESETIPICHQNPPSTLGKKKTLCFDCKKQKHTDMNYKQTHMEGLLICGLKTWGQGSLPQAGLGGPTWPEVLSPSWLPAITHEVSVIP